MAAVVCGAEGWEEIEDFGKEREDWLRQYLPFANGIPGHDTIARVMSRLNPKALQESFVAWMQDVVTLTERTVIAIDGKTVRRSFKSGDRKSAIHMVNAWAAANNMVLGQLKVDSKTNEITAIPELLSILAIKGCIITIDAMGCQTKIAEKIVSGKADYVIGLKKNQPELCRATRELFALPPDEVDLEEASYQEITKDHGRIETRICRHISIDKDWLPESERWPGLKSVIEIKSIREIIGGNTTEEHRYYISSLKVNAKEAFNAVKTHWTVENSLHWSLDMSFREDECRIRRDNGAEFFAVMRRLSINVIKKDTSKKAGIHRKQRMAAMNPDYAMHLLRQFQDS
jgi:predicted transposase YbfD/YdcC